MIKLFSINNFCIIKVITLVIQDIKIAWPNLQVYMQKLKYLGLLLL